MYGTYLRRELAGRKRQTMIVAIGLAIAIALVIIVNALTAGVRDAQAQALESVYGVGTDLTVTGAAAEPGEGGGQRFDFGSEDGSTEGDTTTLSQSTLMTDFMRGTLDASVLDTVTSSASRTRPSRGSCPAAASERRTGPLKAPPPPRATHRPRVAPAEARSASTRSRCSASILP